MGVQAKPEFAYQNCVRLIGHGGDYKHSCALKSLSIENTCSITNFMLWSQRLKKICSKLSEWNIFCDKNFFWGCLCGENVRITHRVHLFYFLFMDSYWLFTNFPVILHVPIWVLLILGAHPFSGSTYGPDGRYDPSSISNTHGVKLSLGVINT